MYIVFFDVCIPAQTLGSWTSIHLFAGGRSYFLLQPPHPGNNQSSSRSNGEASRIPRHICMYVCMYVCMYPCMYVRTYSWILLDIVILEVIITHQINWALPGRSQVMFDGNL